MKTIITPIKKFFNIIINKKILNRKEEPKLGFDREYDVNENIEIECNNFRNQEIENYYKKSKKI